MKREVEAPGAGLKADERAITKTTPARRKNFV